MDGPPAVKQNKCKSIPMTPRVTHTHEKFKYPRANPKPLGLFLHRSLIPHISRYSAKIAKIPLHTFPHFSHFCALGFFAPSTRSWSWSRGWGSCRSPLRRRARFHRFLRIPPAPQNFTGMLVRMVSLMEASFISLRRCFSGLKRPLVREKLYGTIKLESPRRGLRGVSVAMTVSRWRQVRVKTSGFVESEILKVPRVRELQTWRHGARSY